MDNGVAPLLKLLACGAGGLDVAGLCDVDGGPACVPEASVANEAGRDEVWRRWWRGSCRCGGVAWVAVGRQCFVVSCGSGVRGGGVVSGVVVSGHRRWGCRVRGRLRGEWVVRKRRVKKVQGRWPWEAVELVAVGYGV